MAKPIGGLYFGLEAARGRLPLVATLGSSDIPSWPCSIGRARGREFADAPASACARPSPLSGSCVLDAQLQLPTMSQYRALF